MFTSDLAASAFVFLLIVNISLLTWNLAYSNQTAFNEERDLRERVVRVSDLLVRTPGYPSNWTAETVDVIGLVSIDHVLDNRKLLQFRNMSYTMQRDLLRADSNDVYVQVRENEETATIDAGTLGGIGTEPVAYIVRSGASMNEARILSALNRSTVSWELYWPSSMDTDKLDSLTAQNVYNHTTDAPTMMDNLLKNISTYDTVIAEDVTVSPESVAYNDNLTTFVEAGGTYLHTGEDTQMLSDVFALKNVSVGSTTTTVNAVDPLLNNTYSEGDSVTLASAPTSFTGADTVYLKDSQSPNGCLACRWRIGAGNVYYAADTETSSGTTTVFTSATDAFTGNMFLEFGKPATEETNTVAVSNRQIIINRTNGFDRGTLRVVLWN